MTSICHMGTVHTGQRLQSVLVLEVILITRLAWIKRVEDLSGMQKRIWPTTPFLELHLATKTLGAGANPLMPLIRLHQGPSYVSLFNNLPDTWQFYTVRNSERVSCILWPRLPQGPPLDPGWWLRLWWIYGFYLVAYDVSPFQPFSREKHMDFFFYKPKQ